MFKKIREKRSSGEYRNILEVGNDWALLRKYFLENARGVEKYAICEENLSRLIFEEMDKMTDEQIKRLEK